MKVNIDFAEYVAVIEFEDFLGEDIKKYQKEFEKWYFQRIRKMKYKSKKENEIFDANLIVEWLKNVSPNCKAKIVEPFLNIGEEDKSLPYMYFKSKIFIKILYIKNNLKILLPKSFPDFFPTQYGITLNNFKELLEKCLE